MSPAELRALGRLGRRTARREWRRTLLITILVAVPVAASLVVAGIVRANEVSPEQQLASTFGAADLRIELPSELAERAQAWVEGTVRDLTPGAKVQTHRQTHDATLGQVTDVDLGAELSEGLLAVWDGRLPEAVGEVAMTPRLLRRLEVGLGDTVTAADRELTVVGMVVDDVWYHREASVVTPELMTALEESSRSVEHVTRTLLVAGVDQPGPVADQLERAWASARGSFLPEPAVTPTPPELATLAPELYASLDAGAIDTLVELAPTVDAWELEDLAWQLADHSSPAWAEPWITNREWELATWGQGYAERLMTPGVVATFVAGILLAEVALVAGAAYATGARRRLRELGLLGANGATVWHVRTTILGEAVVAGVLGALAGIGLGVVALSAGKPLLQPIVDRYLVGLPLTGGAIAGPALAGVVAVTAAAWLPARNAARVSTTTALQGRMPLAAPPRWLVPGGIVIGGFGALMTTVALAAGGGGASEALAVIGILTAIIGTALLTPPIIAGIGRLADRLPATWRLVVRDSARQRTRAAAATAAAMVLLMAPVLIGLVSASDEARQQVRGLEQPRDQVAVAPTAWMDGRPIPYGVVEDAAVEVPRDARVTADAIAEILPHAHRAEVPLLPIWATPATAPSPDEVVGTYGYQPSSPADWEIAAGVGTADVVEALGDARVGATLRDGVPVVLGVRERDTSVTLDDGTVLAAREVPMGVPWTFPRLLLPPGAAEDLGVWASMELTLFTGAALDGDVEQQLWDTARAVEDGALLAVGWQRLTPTTISWIAVGATLLVALLILGLVTALSSTESDHDLRTMVAVGAAPRMRRGFLALQTGYHALIGALLALPLGVGLYWALVRGDGWPTVGPFGIWMSNAIAVPWAVLLAVIVGVPAVIAVLTAVLFRSAPTVAPRRIG